MRGLLGQGRSTITPQQIMEQQRQAAIWQGLGGLGMGLLAMGQGQSPVGGLLAMNQAAQQANDPRLAIAVANQRRQDQLAAAKMAQANRPQFKDGYWIDPVKQTVTPDPNYQQKLPTGFVRGPDGKPQVMDAYRDFALEKAQAGAARTNVTNAVPRQPPPGYRYIFNDAGNVVSSEPIPGSEPWREIKTAEEAARKAGETASRSGGLVTEDIQRGLEIVDNANLPVTGLIGDLLSRVGGTDARDLRGLMDTVRANIGFDRLQRMRSESPTGGALGNVTEKELSGLQATMGNLEQSQSEDQFRYNAKRLHNQYLDIIHGTGEGPKRYDLSSSRKQKPGRSPRQSNSEGEFSTLSDQDLRGISEMSPDELQKRYSAAQLEALAEEWDRRNGR